jgi:hypothetical protein
MSTIGRSILLIILFAASAFDGSPSVAGEEKVQSQTTPAGRMSTDGNFAHYLVSATGSIDGIVLEDGTVARFPLFRPVFQTAFLRPGDTVHIEGDGLSGPTGPVLINASVEVRSRVAAPAEAKPTQSLATSSKPGSRHGREHGPRAAKGQGKNASKRSATDRPLASSSFFWGIPDVSAAIETRPESFWLRLSHMTTGTGHVYIDPHWRRVNETSGP